MSSPTGEARFTFDGQRWTLVFDMAAIAFFEREAGVSIIEAMADIEAARLGGRPPKVSHLAMLVQAGLRRHHPEVSADDALVMACDAEVQQQLGAAVEASSPPGNAPARSKGSARSTGTKPSKVRSKQG